MLAGCADEDESTQGRIVNNPRTRRTSVFPSISISCGTADDSMKDNSPTYIIIQRVLDVKEKKRSQLREEETKNTKPASVWMFD